MQFGVKVCAALLTDERHLLCKIGPRELEKVFEMIKSSLLVTLLKCIVYLNMRIFGVEV